MSRRAVRDGFDQWSSVTPLSFTEVPSGGDLKVRWAIGNHGDGNAFDGQSGVLAHAFYPQDGRVHFDDDELWSDSLIPIGTDLASVAVHELGHALGLAHSNDPFAVMYAYYSGRRRSLTSDDISGIQSIYVQRTGVEYARSLRLFRVRVLLQCTLICSFCGNSEMKWFLNRDTGFLLREFWIVTINAPRLSIGKWSVLWRLER